MAQEVPVYVFTGFMDSGKTTLIQETLFENDFTRDKDSVLILACEDGEKEYAPEDLARIGAVLEMVESREDFSYETLVRLSAIHRPAAVFLEYNGTWETGPLYEMRLPEGWVIVQSLATVDAGTFEMYQLNMRAMIMEQIFRADVVIFNRCTDETPKGKFRGAVKTVNRPAQIVYERIDGTVDEDDGSISLDLDAPVLEISDADYALWFIDCMEHSQKYDGKTVHFKALVYNPNDGKLRRDVFIPGRFAMTCCVEDIQFLGMKCKFPGASEVGHKTWIDLTARVKSEFAKEYKGKGPVLYPEKVEPAQAPEDELVYFS